MCFFVIGSIKITELFSEEINKNEYLSIFVQKFIIITIINNFCKYSPFQK